MATRSILPRLFIVGDSLALMAERDGCHVVKHVLSYLEVMERAASLRNRRLQIRHYQQCWLTVWEAYNGADNDPAVECLPEHTAAGVTLASERPRWFKEKYSRPVRQVTARVTRRISDGRGCAVSHVSYDVLSCGHQIESLDLGPDDKPAKHRRCKECGGEKWSQPIDKSIWSSHWPESSKQVNRTRR